MICELYDKPMALLKKIYTANAYNLNNPNNKKLALEMQFWDITLLFSFSDTGNCFYTIQYIPGSFYAHTHTHIINKCLSTRRCS